MRAKDGRSPFQCHLPPDRRRAVEEALREAPVAEVALRFNTSKQTVYAIAHRSKDPGVRPGGRGSGGGDRYALIYALREVLGLGGVLRDA